MAVRRGARVKSRFNTESNRIPVQNDDVQPTSKADLRTRLTNWLGYDNIDSDGGVIKKILPYRLALNDRNSALNFYLTLVLLATALIVAIGLVMVLSASSVTSVRFGGSAFGQVKGQALYAFLGIVGAIAVSFMPLRAKWFGVVAGVGFTIAVAIQLVIFIFPQFAISAGGNVNWLRIGSIGIQPSEFLKIALAVWLAYVLSRSWTDLDSLGGMAIGILSVLLALGAVLAGEDMGTAIIFAMMVGAVYIVAGIRWYQVLLVSLAVLIALGVLILRTPSRILRLAQFFGFSSASNDLHTGYQPLHGRYALGTGGISGVGLGASREKWSYLPAAANDYIFAIIGEELGLLGTLSVVVLFVLLGYALYQIIMLQRNQMYMFLLVGIGVWIFGQAMVNMAVVAELLPVIGLPLPFISAGGSSMISCLIAIGFVVAVVRSDQTYVEISRHDARQALGSASVTVKGRTRR